MADLDPLSDTVSGPATIDDVAREAGVSTATVSRALRNHPHVAETTRDRVLAAVDRLSYVANPNAARLASGNTRTIGLLAPLLTSWYTGELVAGVEEVCSEHGFDLLIGSADPEARERLFHSDARFHQRIDGAILVDVLCGEVGARQLAMLDTPVVVLGEHLDAVASASIDNVAGGRLAAAHLLELGHRRIAVVKGGGHLDVSRLSGLRTVPDDRMHGFTEALTEAGIALRAADIRDGDFTIQGGRVAMNALLSLPEPPTAVFCMSDEMAFGALQTIRERGLVAGHDVSVIGFDDHTVAESVGLTTIRQRVRHIGRLGARTLLGVLAGGPPSGHQPVDLTLVVRSTTGAPA
jgi:LacI family repressor for deo operon, udp, cdd, tsx, nupC, and nupG